MGCDAFEVVLLCLEMRCGEYGAIQSLYQIHAATPRFRDIASSVPIWLGCDSIVQNVNI